MDPLSKDEKVFILTALYSFFVKSINLSMYLIEYFSINYIHQILHSNFVFFFKKNESITVSGNELNNSLSRTEAHIYTHTHMRPYMVYCEVNS